MKYAPTIARYILLIVGTKIASGGGVIPPQVAQAMAADPVLIEMTTGILIDLGAIVWFVRSKARAAIAKI